VFWASFRSPWNWIGLLVLPVSFLAAYSAFPSTVLVPVAVILTTAYWWLVGAPAIWTSRGLYAEDDADLDDLGIRSERLLVPAIEAELARSRRYGHEFAVVLATVDLAHRRFDYREDEAWRAAFAATAQLLQQTRSHLDRVYRMGADGFALLLSESGPDAVEGLVRRLRRLARLAEPAEGEPGGPLPLHFGATLFPSRATTVEALLRRAGLALRLAERSATRLHLDGAEALEGLPPASLRARSDGVAGRSPAEGDDKASQA
jgi:GGDEF domain-containing protein